MKALISNASGPTLALAAMFAVAGCPAGGPAVADLDGGAGVGAGDGGASLAPTDGGTTVDSGADDADRPDGGHGQSPDGGDAVDAGSASDAGSAADGGSAVDGGVDDVDAGEAVDAGDAEASTGELWFMTYNVAGLPQGISSSDPLEYMPQISPLLNDYDLVVVQEDFWFHDELVADVTLPYVSEPMVENPTLIPVNIGDGLNRFSAFPLGPLERTTWAQCSGWTDCSNDCPADKGYSVSEVTLAPGVVVDVYNLHMDAGGCPGDHEARLVGAQQLAAAINARSSERAIIVAGDTNLNENREDDVTVLDMLLEDTGLEIACRLAECDDESIDRIMIRSGGGVELEIAEWVRPTHFVDSDGADLSDHEPTTALIRWTKLP